MSHWELEWLTTSRPSANLARGLNGKSTAYTTIAYTTKAYTTIVHQVSPGPYYYWSVKMFKIGRYVTAEAVVPDEDHSINDFL